MRNAENNTFNILIVDDEPDVVNTFARLFRRLHPSPPKISYQVLQALEGKEAMSILTTQRVDCVLLDYNMPGGNGLFWLKKMLNLNKDTAIIMITGAGNENIAVEAMKNGAMDYLVKGAISIEDLERAILNAVDKIEMRKTLEQQRKDLIDAERQRVMIESLGAACHHLGQPATVINTYLQIMKKQEKSPETLKMIEECASAANAMSDILDKLRKVSQYRTVPYRLAGESEPHRTDEKILDIDQQIF